jgi:hypothetical protein
VVVMGQQQQQQQQQQRRARRSGSGASSRGLRMVTIRDLGPDVPLQQVMCGTLQQCVIVSLTGCVTLTML